MRSRATSIYMKNSPYQSAPTKEPQPALNTKKERLSSEAMVDLFSEFGPMSYGQLKDAFSGDFAKPEIYIPDNCSNRSTERASVGPALSRTSSSSSEYTSFEEELKENKFLRSMIIAHEQASGYQVVDLLFPELKHETLVDESHPKKFDMTTKKIEDEAQIGRFHFWLKEAEGKDQSRGSSLFNTYYKSSFVFFLIYNKNDAKSFDLIKNEAEQICQTNNGQRFFVLIEADGVHGETNTSLEELNNFKRAHEINASITMKELGSQSETIRKQLLLLAKSSF